ncbi:MAG: FtsQ-type POTRA domain-containing protein [Gammaproteobacteria bacterium]|nr:FtsQ-type POTRA domain-containing protein [Gammaproteobacteria bacterium]
MAISTARKPFQRNRAQSRRPWRAIALLLFSLISMIILIDGGVRAWAWMQKPTSFPIKQIQVEGQFSHVSSTEITKIIQARMRGGFFSLHLSSAKQAILAFPWVAHVSFRRVWPGILNVRVQEQQSVARFEKNGILNAEGAVFYPDIKTIPQNLPDLEGPVDQASVLLNFYQTANTLVKLLGLSVISLHVNAEQSWDMQLSNQVQVMMGRTEALTRLKRFVTIYPKITALSNQPILIVDLRYPNGVAVQYQPQQNILRTATIRAPKNLKLSPLGV